MLGTTNASTPNNAEAITKIDRDLGYSVGDSQTVKSDLAEIKASLPSSDTVTVTVSALDTSMQTVILNGIATTSGSYQVNRNSMISCHVRNMGGYTGVHISFNEKTVGYATDSVSFYFFPGNSISQIRITKSDNGSIMKITTS